MNLPVEQRRQWIRSRREQRKLTRTARLRRQFLRYSMLFALMFLGSTAFSHTHWLLSDNQKPTINVKGNVVASNEQIEQTLYKAINNYSFTLDPKELEKKVEKLSIIRKAFVRRYALPVPSLEVTVLEEFPWATLSVDPDSPPQYVVAESGRLISVQDFPRVFQPTLKIYATKPQQANFNSNNVEHWANWIAYVEKQMQTPVIALDMRQSNDIKIETPKLTLALGSPDSSITRRLNRLASVTNVLAHENRQPSYINLGLNNNIPVIIAKKSQPNIQ